MGGGKKEAKVALIKPLFRRPTEKGKWKIHTGDVRMKGLISNSSFPFIYDSVVFAVNRNENCKGAFAQRQGFSYLPGVALLSSPHAALLFPSPSESGSVAV